MGCCGSQWVQCVKEASSMREWQKACLTRPAPHLHRLCVPDSLRPSSSEEASWSTVSCHHDFFRWLAKAPKRTPLQSAEQHSSKNVPYRNQTCHRSAMACPRLKNYEIKPLHKMAKWKYGTPLPALHQPNTLGWPLFIATHSAPWLTTNHVQQHSRSTYKYTAVECPNTDVIHK